MGPRKFLPGGYIEVQPDMVTLLADTALRAKDLDEAEAELSRQEAERAMNEKVTEIEFAEAAARLSQAMAQQRTMEELRDAGGDNPSVLAFLFNLVILPMIMRATVWR